MRCQLIAANVNVTSECPAGMWQTCRTPANWSQRPTATSHDAALASHTTCLVSCNPPSDRRGHCAMRSNSGGSRRRRRHLWRCMGLSERCANQIFHRTCLFGKFGNTEHESRECGRRSQRDPANQHFAKGWNARKGLPTATCRGVTSGNCRHGRRKFPSDLFCAVPDNHQNFERIRLRRTDGMITRMDPTKCHFCHYSSLSVL